jgi:hypothetical protein
LERHEPVPEACVAPAAARWSSKAACGSVRMRRQRGSIAMQRRRSCLEHGEVAAARGCSAIFVMVWWGAGEADRALRRVQERGNP